MTAATKDGTASPAQARPPVARLLCWVGLHAWRNRAPAHISHFERCTRCRRPGINRRS